MEVRIIWTTQRENIETLESDAGNSGNGVQCRLDHLALKSATTMHIGVLGNIVIIIFFCFLVPPVAKIPGVKNNYYFFFNPQYWIPEGEILKTKQVDHSSV